MGFIPPHPGFESNTLSLVRRLSWSPVDGEVGQLEGGWLALAGSPDGAALWCADAGHAPTGIAPRLVSKEAFEAMRDGKREPDGSLLWQGKRWTLADVAEGSRLVARLVSEGTAA